jgi:hypothetical protein
MKGNYIPVLVCSSEKIKDWFIYRDETIKFFASPDMAPKDFRFTYHGLDDKIRNENRTWRELTVNGQNDPSLNLIKAYHLYKPKAFSSIYENLYKKFNHSFYILSAGWGIIRADFRIPAYNITFSTAPSVPKYAQRSVDDVWPDINHLKEDVDNEKYAPDSKIILFAGKDYLPYFRRMTKSIPKKKLIVLYYEKNPAEKEGFFYNCKYDGFRYLYYKTTENPRNWHYKAAHNFLIP